MVKASKRDESEWFGFGRSRDRVESSDVDVTTAPSKAWSSDHRRRLLQTPTAKGLVPVMGVERVDNQFKAFELPPPGTSLAALDAEGKRTKWREQAAIVEGAARATHEGHLLGLEHGALSEASVHIADRDIAVSGMGLTRGASLPDDPALVAPEVLAGATPTVRSDVYSLAKMLERGLDADLGAVPLALRELVTAATADDPEQRPASALALADGIRGAGGASLPTYALAALGGSTAGRSLGTALARRGGTPLAGDTEKGGAAGAGVGAVAGAGALGAGGLAAARTLGAKGTGSAAAGTGSAGTGSAGSRPAGAGTTSPNDRPKRSKRGAAAAGVALVGIAGLGLWAASGNNGDPTTTDGLSAATTAAPTTQAPTTTAAPTTQAPTTTAAPTTAAPTTIAPTTTAPTTIAPTTTTAPTTAAPTTIAPTTTAAPTTAAPTTTQAPTTAAPTTPPLAPAVALQADAAASSYEILHAIPGVAADAYLDGELAASGFEPGMVAGPVSIDQGLETLALFAAIDNPPASAADRTDEPIVETSLVDADPGTLVAYLDGDTPRIATFANDLTYTPAGQGRVTIRQFSPAVGVVLVDGEPVEVPAAPANGATLELPAGQHTLSATDESGAVLFDETIEVADGQLSSLFVRPADDGDGATLSVRVVTGLSSAPSGIPSGTGGLLNHDGPDGLLPALAMMLALGGGGVMLQQRWERRVR